MRPNAANVGSVGHFAAFCKSLIYDQNSGVKRKRGEVLDINRRSEKELLAARLRFARDLAGITQEKAASALGIRRTAYTQIEAGNRDISALELQRLACVLMLDVSDLLTPQPLESAFPLIHVDYVSSPDGEKEKG